MNKSNKTAQRGVHVPGVHAQSHMDTYLAGFIRSRWDLFTFIVARSNKRAVLNPEFHWRLPRLAFAAVAASVCEAGCGVPHFQSALQMLRTVCISTLKWRVISEAAFASLITNMWRAGRWHHSVLPGWCCISLKFWMSNHICAERYWIFRYVSFPAHTAGLPDGT